MPLRARITHPAFTAAAAAPARQYASSSSSSSSTPSDVAITEQPGDEPNDVLFNAQYGLRTITLNRPKKLNSLDASMCRKILPRLQEWGKSQLANVVVIKGEGRAFCAGGDVAHLAKRNLAGAPQESKDYFALEYKLDHYIATYTKPYVAFLDGITMGGGVGLSINGPFRVATENTVFAMPETTIGFFPDVGASFFLPRMAGGLGLYLALTSEQLKGPNVYYAGVATHYLHSSSLPDLEARLAELQFNDYDPLDHRLRLINSTIDEFCTGMPHDQPLAAPIAGNIRKAIDYVFSKNRRSIDECLRELDTLAASDAPDVADWAAKTKKTILQRSPTSVKVTFRQLREAERWNIAETFVREHGIASRFMDHPDFAEGVSALLIDKPKRTPNWSPASLADVSDATVDEFFPPADRLGLPLLRSGDAAQYSEYPYDASIGLPKERAFEAFVQGGRAGGDAAQVVEHFVQRSGNKQGVREQVSEWVQRRTELAKDQNGRPLDPPRLVLQQVK